MATATHSKKTECLNPTTGGRKNIDTSIYEPVSKAIYHTLKSNQPLSFTQIAEGVHDCFKKTKSKFPGSVDWYTITVVKDMEARGIIETFTDKGKKFRLVKK